VHWADGASLDLLRHLAAEVRRSRLLVLVSARDGDGAELLPALAELVLLPGVELVPLDPLPVAGVAAYLSAAAGRPVDPAAVQLVHQRSGGNPLYVRTVARVLGRPCSSRSSCRRSWPPGWPAAARSGTWSAPCCARWTTGSGTCSASASLLGEEVDPALLASVTQRPLADVEAGLDAAGAAGLLGPGARQRGPAPLRARAGARRRAERARRLRPRPLARPGRAVLEGAACGAAGPVRRGRLPLAARRRDP
jgi:hypothetical protein